MASLVWMNGAARFDRLWARLTRVVSFMVGVAIMGYETGFDKADRPWLYAAAIGMMGLPVARAAENVLERLSTQGPTQVPGGGQAEVETESQQRPPR